jgi:hypothetical protein
MAGVHDIDKYSVVGMYPYLSDYSAENYHEIDIEQAKWGSDGSTNFDFWIQPNSAHLNQLFTLPYTANDTTFVIDWEHGFVQFYILDTGSNAVLRNWNVTVTRDATGVYGITNAWHYLHAPTIETNVIFKSFIYQANTIYHPPVAPEPALEEPTPVEEGPAYDYHENDTTTVLSAPVLSTNNVSVADGLSDSLSGMIGPLITVSTVCLVITAVAGFTRFR